MRVLQLLKTSVGAKWALLQMRELVQLGLDVHVALPPGGPLIPAYAAAGVSVHPAQFDFPARRPWQLPRMLGELRSLIAELNPDLVHSHFVGTTLMMRLALGKSSLLPRVFQVPGPLHLESAFFRWAELSLASQADYWIGSCQWTCARYAAAGIPVDRIFLSYYGTDVSAFVPRATGKLRRELGLSADRKVVGMVAFMYGPKWYLGQTRGIKGHEDLIDAIKICLNYDPNITVVFLGGAWDNAVAYEQHIRSYARRRLGDRAVFLGPRRDVPDLYPDFDVVVHPSHSENVGGAAESLLLAVPTIATDVGGFPDVVIPGRTGWLTQPKQPRQLAMAILEALRDPNQAHTMARAGSDRVHSMFDVKRTAGEVLGIYRQIVADQGSSRKSG